MKKGIFITATGTEVGKTYISAILLEQMREQGINCGYYKPVLSGASEEGLNDCEYVAKKTGVKTFCSYMFEPPVSPHLAAELAGMEIKEEKILEDFQRFAKDFDYVLVEGAGGIFTPLGKDLAMPDIIKTLGLDIIIIADAGLGTINATVLTVDYARAHGINIEGIILNRYDETNLIHRNNREKIEELTGVKMSVLEEGGNPPLGIFAQIDAAKIPVPPQGGDIKACLPALLPSCPPAFNPATYPIWHPCSQMKDYEEFPPIVIERGEGLYLYDTEGKRYADVVSSWWCNLLGHCNPRINAAVKKQIDKLEHVIFANFSHKKALELCEKLSKYLPRNLEKFFFTDNGSSAIEAAMKMSFQYHQQSGNPQKQRFMALTDAYHGETIGALSVGGVDLYSEIYKPVLLDVIRLQTGNFAQAEEMFAQHGDETCALVVEPILQAAAGMKIYSADYLRRLRELCDKYNVHLIADEIATGYGRTGKMFACEHAGISPDIMCLSKGLTGGYMPMALTITTKDIYDAFYCDYTEYKAFLHSHTYSGNPLACAAAVEVLSIFEEENILQKAQEKASYFSQLVRDKFSQHPNVGEIRSIGLINAIELVQNNKEKTPFDPKTRKGYNVYRGAIKSGLILRPLGDVIYFNPPLTISKSEMCEAVDIAYESLCKVLPY